jgi:hypothetical protein
MQVAISTKNQFGNYNTRVLTFKNHTHLDNYLRVVLRSSSKLIGHEILDDL